MIYLDNSATTLVMDEVLDEIINVNKNFNFNPSAAYDVALDVEKRIKKYRNIIADSINASSEEIFFTSGGTESNNTAIQGIAKANSNKGKHIITSSVEHDSVYNTFKYLEENCGFEVTYLKPDKKGYIDVDTLTKHIKDDTIFISIMMVNNELGVIYPIEEMVKEAKKINPNLYFHVDCVQSYMKLPIDVKKLDIDAASFSAHKIYSSKGTGFLYVKSGTKIQPLVYGGGQEMQFRSGTENVSGICALGKSVEILNNKYQEYYEYVQKLKSKFIAFINDNISDCQINSNEDYSCAYILNVSFKGIMSEVLIHYLESKKIYISAGSACSSKKKGSRILKNIELPNELKNGTLRISFSPFNTESDIETACNELKKAVDDIRMITKFKK